MKLESLIYLDREYISNFYEIYEGKSPDTEIVRTETIKAGVSIPLFSGGAASTESKKYTISSLQMLQRVLPKLEVFGQVEHSQIQLGKHSITGWVEGNFTVERTVKKQSEKREFSGRPHRPNLVIPYDPVIGEQTYFGISFGNQGSLALITSPEYFVSGFDAFIKLSEVVLDRLNIPVRALVRIYSANTEFGQWLATPLYIYENR